MVYDMSAVKPQDLLVLLKLVAVGGGIESRQVDLAHTLEISQAEVHNALRRAAKSGFFMPEGRLTSSNVKRSALAEFLVHGAKYVFPARLGEVTRGLPTAYGLPALANGFHVHTDDTPVWPWSRGGTRGSAVEPLYKSVPQAAVQDPKLHELLALLDSIRIGRARDREVASQRLREELEA